MKKLIVLLAIISGFAANAQVNYILKNNGNTMFPVGSQIDTVVKSTTDYVSIPLNDQSIAQYVSYSISIDSVGGSPACTIFPMASNDGIHWAAQGSNIVITTKSTWAKTTLTPGVSDTTVVVATNPWTARWLRLKFVWTSATQRAKYYIAVQTNNIH